jgi:membrane-bound lytic murein transglycosylase D
MLRRFVGIIACLALIAGCGGAHQGALVQPAPVTQVETEPVDLPDQEETLAETLSTKRLEELYAKSGIPGWDPALEEELKKWDHQVKFDVPIEMNRQVRAYLVYFSTERKTIFTRYLSRSTRYLPMIKETFQEYGLPDDLAYLALIESGFNNKATSHAAAVGMWQFIRGTAVRYGLTVDSYLDERRDPEKSTKSAAKYLLDLYKQFGSWYLAAASYNCGEGRVQRELNQSNHKNFWQLSENQCLPNETKNYVPQMIAATIIAKNPEKFGFKNVPYLPPLKYELAQMKNPTSLKAAAAAINVPVEDIQALNPELLRGVTPPDAGAYILRLPPKSLDLFAKNIEVARIEHPAIATRPVRAKAPVRYASRGSTKAAAKKAEARNKKVAKASKKKEAATVAKKGKTAGPASPQMASVFGSPSAIAGKAQANGQKKSNLAADSKGKSKTQTQAQNKARNTQVAKKADANNGKSNSKAKKSGKNGKGKVTKSNGKNGSQMAAHR